MSAVTEIAAGIAGSSALSYQLTLTGSANIGDLVVVVGGNSNTNTLASSAVTDSQGNTWALARQTTQGSATRSGIWYSVLTTALNGGTDWIKLTTSSSTNSWKTLYVLKLSSASAISLDKINSHDAQATNTTMTPGTTGALAQAVELAVVLYQYANVNSPAFTAPAGWSQTATTQQVAGGTNVNAVSGVYLVTAATTALNPSATLSQTNTYGAAIATFAFTSGGATNITPTSNITAGVTSVSGGVSRGNVPLVSATINVTATVSNRAPDVLFSVSVFGAVGTAPNVPIVPGASTITIAVAGAVSILGQAGAGYSSRRTEGFAHVIGFP